MHIDTFAYSNRWRRVHPGEKAIFALCCLTAALLSRTVLIPLIIAALMAAMTIMGAGIPWRGYLRIAILPAAFLIWSCLALAVSFSGGELPLAHFPALQLDISFSRQGINQAELALARSLGATLSLLFLALTTPMTEIMGLLRSIGTPKLFIELMTITYRQIFIFLDMAGQIRAAQEARLGYASAGKAIRSMAGMAGNILLRTLTRARHNHQALLARGYGDELLFLSPRRNWSTPNLLAAGSAGIILIALALAIHS
ncbi:MAG: cobalt ECF transporter T component CbiQ [Steroidobacteraceae bacterium]|nr:cobalt ECF transporter T component CbiQ [Deltaproteobacteria bacterium]